MTEYQKLLSYLKIAYHNLTTLHRNLVHDAGWFGNHEQLGDWYGQISDQLDDLTETGIALIADALNAILRPDQTTTVLLETMAGKGSEVGGRFEELREILDRVELSGKMGVCLDTYHVSDAGYDISSDLDGVLTEFDRIIGLDRLKAIHLNDSKNPIGARKDRHERIGFGCIGLEALTRVVRHPALRDLPFCLETPNELPGYGEEIALMRQQAAL